MNYKLLKITFVILLLVTFSELAYYVYYHFNVRNATYTSNNTNQEVTIQIDPNLALNQSALQSLGFFKRGIVTSGTATIEMRGKIIQIEKDGGVTPNGFQYSRLIMIQTPNGLATSLLTNLKHKDIIEVTQEINGKNKIISFDDLNVNDDVIIKVTYDLLKDPTVWLMKMTIIKINK